MTSTASSAWRGVPYLRSRPSMGWAGSFTRTRSRRRSGCFALATWCCPRRWPNGSATDLAFTPARWALEQLTLARFMESGDYERHVNRQRTRYRRRLSALIDVLAASSAGDHLHFANAGAGLHFSWRLGVSKETREIVRLSRSAWPGALRFGVRLAPLGRYRSRAARRGAPGRSSNETVGCRCEAREVEGARRVCDEVRSGCSEMKKDDPGGSRDRLGGGGWADLVILDELGGAFNQVRVGCF